MFRIFPPFCVQLVTYAIDPLCIDFGQWLHDVLFFSGLLCLCNDLPIADGDIELVTALDVIDAAHQGAIQLPDDGVAPAQDGGGAGGYKTFAERSQSGSRER